MKKNTGTFLTEALIISVSNLISKVIGVVFKIPLGNMLQNNMEMFTAAYSVYAMLFMLSNAGLPVALSRAVAVAAAKGRKKEEGRVFWAGKLLFGSIGTVLMLAMLLGANAIADYSEHADAALAIRLVAPCLPLVCVSSSLRGFFQGHRIMMPTAIYHFLESFFKMAVGLGAAYYAVSHNYSAPVQAAFAILGITAGSLAGLIYLIITKYLYEKKHREILSLECDDYPTVYKNLLKVALPVAATSTALYLSNFLDTLVIKKGLIASGVTEEISGRLYTAYTTLALSVSDLLPATFVYPIAISILPAITQSFTVGDVKKAREYMNHSIRISAIIGMPCAFLMFAVARPVLVFLYGSAWGGSSFVWNGTEFWAVDIAANGLRILSLGIIGISLLSTTNSLLPAIKKSHLTTVSVFTGVAALAVTEIVLIRVPSVGIYGAPVASVVCYTVALSLNLFFLKRLGYIERSFTGMFAKPLIAALLCGAAAVGTVYGASLIINAERRLGAFAVMCAGGVVGVIVYIVALLALKGITAEEIRLLPKGRKLCDFMLKKGWITENQ